VSTHPARAFWERFEPIHAVTYFADEVAVALAGVGLKGFWRGYFAARGGPLGPAGANVVQATFFGFSPVLVNKVIPSAWQQASPSTAMAARDDAVEAVLDRLLGDAVDESTVELMELAAAACERTMVGRPLYAAHAGMVPPSSLSMRLWWACTLLREHRGDGHNAALLAAGVDGCMANVLAVAEGVVPAERQQTVRGWSDEDWAAAAARVAALPDPSAFRAAIEARTDALASAPVDALGPDRFAEVCARLDPLVEAVTGTGLIPYPNPVGVTRSDAA
jgi:hypothetical protein